MRTRKKTWLSRLFVELFFWLVGKILEPVPVLGLAVNCLSMAV